MTIYTDGYGGDIFTARDTGVNSGSPTLNYGAAIRLGLYTTRKVLIQFDLSAIPAGSTCNSATLYLYKGSGGGATAVTCTIYPIAVGNAGWPEGNKAPGTGGAGDCCWNYFEQTPGSETAWAGSAGLSTAGTDFVNTAMGTWNLNSGDANGTEYAIALDTAVVEGWFGASNDNYGMLITSNATAGEICSSDYTADTSWRPKLVVDYTEAAGNVTVNMATAALTTAAQALDVVPGAVSIAMDAAILTTMARAAVVNPLTFVDGYGGDVNTAKDAQMSSSWPTFNGGGHANFQFATNQRSLMEFDLSSIPAGSTVIEAKLHVFHSYEPEGGGVITVNIHSIAAANAAWAAGNNDISLADAGECCWDALAADGSGGVTTPWAGSAGLATAGTDYDTTPIGSFAFDGGSAIGTEYVVDLDPTRVAGWCGASNTNYGLILIGSANSGHIAQSDNATTGYRPKLVVIYKAAAENVVISMAVASLTTAAQALDVAPGAVTISLDPASLAASALALDVMPGAAAIAMATAALTTAAQALDVVPGAVSIGMSVAGITAQAQGLSVIPGPVSISMGVGALSAQARTLTVLGASITISMGLAQLTTAAQALDVVPGAVTIALQPATLVPSAQNLDIIPGAVTLNMTTAALVAAGLPLTITITSPVTTLTFLTLRPRSNSATLETRTDDLTLRPRTNNLTLEDL